MTHTLSRLAFIAALSAAVPTAAAAQTFLTPYAGVSRGGDAEGTPLTYGASLMWVNQIGLELDFSYSPDFFGEEADLVFIGDSNVTSLMANIVIAPGAGPVRPYVSGGGGLLRTRIDGGALFDDITSNSFGLNAGAGLHVLFSDHAGLRGDIRYFRSVQDLEEDGGDIDLTLGRLSFWRATAGLTIRF